MKKTVIIVIIVFLFCNIMDMSAYTADDASYESMLSASHHGKKPSVPGPDDQFVMDVFFHFSDSLAKVSFAEVRDYLKSIDYQFTYQIGNNKLATMNVDGEVGYVYFCFYPIDSSPSSKDFGNPKKEMLCCIEYSCGDKYMSISNEFHLKSAIMKVTNKNISPSTYEVKKLKSMVFFYNLYIGGAVTLNDTVLPQDALTLDPSSPDAVKNGVESNVKSNLQRYWDTSLVEIISNKDLSSSNGCIVTVVLKWSTKNSKASTKKRLEMFSDDLASRILLSNAGEYISQLWIDWKVPYHLESGYVAQYQYIIKNQHVNRNKTTGYLYEK